MDRSTGSVPQSAVKLGSVAVLLITTLFCGLAPLCITRGTGRCYTDPATRRKFLSLASCFAGGVFLATCLLDLVPGYLVAINEAFNSLEIKLQFPLPEFIMAMGFFLVLLMEQIVLAYKDKSEVSSIGRRAAPGIQSYDKDERVPPYLCFPDSQASTRDGLHFHVDLNSHSAVRSFVLVYSLSLHSLFEGLAVGRRLGSQQALGLGLALLLHKSAVAFGLVLKLTQSHLRPAAVTGCLLAFSVMTPLGIGLSVSLTEMPSALQHRLAGSTLEGLAVGTFLYVTFMEILPHELSPPHDRMPKVMLLLTGFAAVSGFLLIKM